jgi:hypothetical protein
MSLILNIPTKMGEGVRKNYVRAGVSESNAKAENNDFRRQK